MEKFNNIMNKNDKICVVGLGYVGLPLAVLLDTKYNVTGFDINKKRITDLKNNFDETNEINKDMLVKCQINFTSNPEVISEAKIIIVTVPTPVDEYKNPDLTPVIKATTTVGKQIKKGAVVVYESTVYPGVTEEICVPILEKESNLCWKKDFNVGYSPERVNPGDKEHTIDKIKKIVSGDTKETLDLLSSVYGSVIIAGIHNAESIKTAEAAKVIENIQRDLNIALMNELSVIFHKMDIDTKSVLEAAGTKWNFIPFSPGLVGGHCIGVDPYYLTFKAESIGYHPQVILAGRRINDSMGKYIAENTVKQLIKAGKSVKNSKVLILGVTFKEDCPDIRNTKVIDVYNELKDYEINAQIFDPFADKFEAKNEYNIELIENASDFAPYDAIILAVKHKIFLELFGLTRLKELSNNNQVILIDIKGLYDKEKSEQKGFFYWRL